MDDEDDVVCVTLMGQTIRVHVDAISIQGRYAAGVRVATMKFKDDSIVAIASTERDDEEEVEEPEGSEDHNGVEEEGSTEE